MFLYLNILVLLFLEGTLSSPLTTPLRGCPTCKGKQSQSQPSGDLNATTLALGEPCGVYTLSCSQGLRCEPLKDEPRPLRALLEGRGVCNNSSSATPTEVVQIVETYPAPTEHPDEAPCRKLLTSLIKGLDAHLFKTNHDIYMPNCDKHGFFRKKQCWSSRGKQRGKCWCVDENGMPVSPNTKQRGSLSC
ncbi:insulin-like growth factor-binding protein 3 [Melanotaenia boesemani]|uniref:insulin-like growth factor-binding protein 3 n=1 Tax=Melanotaenia boesemani TaxID=1250792 RepID=UPI001C041E72|nr:insulin-like growth factor-binding protein 3 [Melanotaenia boesemani]